MENLRATLTTYRQRWTQDELPEAFEPRAQRECVRNFFNLMAENERCAHRDQFPGHLTASALITTDKKDRLLLTLHRKLDRWLQLGGHADGSMQLHEVALREAKEESGLVDFDFWKSKLLPVSEMGTPLCFDLDIHWIPEGKEPGHYHYDVRYVLVAHSPDLIVASEESTDLKWFSIDEAYAVTAERSLHRLFDKFRHLASLPEPTTP